MPTDPELERAREMGRIEERSHGHAAAIDSLLEDIRLQGADIREMKATLSEIQGAWKMGIRVAAGAGALIGAASAYLGGHLR